MSLSEQEFYQEYWACLALTHTEKLGAKTWKKLLDFYGSANEAVQDAQNWTKRNLVRNSVAQTFCQGHWQEQAQKEWDQVDKFSATETILYIDSRYPERLRQIINSPLYLYALGDIDLFHRPCLAIIGSRTCSRYGLEIARDISYELSLSGITIVSGFAIGIDSQAHLNAMQAHGRSIAVMGTGIDLIYPSRNKKLWQNMSQEGLIVTEFSPETKPEPQNFPQRNRIISGLSLGVLVIEATKNSGSLITARMALEQNREVFAIPGPINYPSFNGCNSLIRKGALLVRSAEDILQELQPILDVEWVKQSPQEQFIDPIASNTKDKRITQGQNLDQDLDPEESYLFKIIQENSNIHIDTITQLMEQKSSNISQLLIKLELKGLIKQLPGMFYTLSTKPRIKDQV